MTAFDWSGISAADEEWTCIQESEAKKQAWLGEAMRVFPAGQRVKVVASDLPEHVGRIGVVRDYDLGGSGEWPIVSINFDGGGHDGFYEDEIEVIS